MNFHFPTFSRFVLGIAIAYGCTNQAHDAISLTSLLSELTDRETLTRFPNPQYSLLQASSWDRSQTGPRDTATWFANKDYRQWIREERVLDRTEYVIMEANGPGAITRWWIPQAAEMSSVTLRIYVDGAPEPVINENFQDFMNGSTFILWPFAFTSSDEKDAKQQYSLPVGHRKQMGADMYFPIPFAKGCKVTLDSKPFYYAINYRLYDSNTKVISFSREEFLAASDAISLASETLLSHDRLSRDSSSKSERIKPGGALEIDLSGRGKAIRGIHLKINSKEKKQLNRGVVLQITFDGKQTVWSPVAEFFGGGVYARPVSNYDIEVGEDGLMHVHWVMPFKENAKIILKNFAEEPVEADLNVALMDYKWDDNSMYFHADWHEEAPLNTPPFKDWNFIAVKGKGTYVGDVLTIYSEPKGWWGEGDEKIYIDGEDFPSHLGTGTEDYYGYAWGMANFFSSPFISMPDRDARGKGDWRGYNTVSRVRLLDAIPFSKALKVDIEAWHPTRGVSYSVTSFWYGDPGATDLSAEALAKAGNVEKDEQAVVRKLPDFPGRQIEASPGTIFPDPAELGLVTPKGNGAVRQAGNHLDFLEWKGQQVKKPLDLDGDDQYGTAGYLLIGVKRFDSGEMAMTKDSLQELPDFVQSLEMQRVTHSFQDAWLFLPDKKAISCITGKIEVSGKIARNGVLTFVVNKNVPPAFRLGVMIDNADTFDKVGKSIWVKTSGGGDSSEIPLARSNRYPDWYFFDIVAHDGDKITIGGTTVKPDDLFSVGAITFDVKSSVVR